jgi:hypothetical protein
MMASEEGSHKKVLDKDPTMSDYVGCRGHTHFANTQSF